MKTLNTSSMKDDDHRHHQYYAAHNHRKSSIHNSESSVLLSSSQPTLPLLPPPILKLTYHRAKSMDQSTLEDDIHNSSHRFRYNYPTSNYDLTKSNTLLERSYPNLFSIKQPQGGRLDLSFTKCRFPNDYLPYASPDRTASNSNSKKRSNSFDVIGFDNSQHYQRTSSDSAFDEQTSTTIHQDDSLDESFPSTKQSTKLNNSTTSVLNPAPSSSTSSSSMLEDNVHHHHHHHHHHHKRRPFLAYPFYPPFRSSSSSSCNDSTTSSKHYNLLKSCGCCLLIILAVLILLSLSIVLGFSLYLAIVTNLLTETTFAYSISGNFKVLSGDNFTILLLNHTSNEFRKKAVHYEKIIQNILHESLIADSILHSEIYTFRQGSLVIFFRFYVAKTTFDQLLAIKKSKTIINFGTIENVYLDDEVIVSRVKQILRDAFKREWTSNHNNSTKTSNLEVDFDSVKIASFDRLTEPQYLERLRRKHTYENEIEIEDQVNNIEMNNSLDDNFGWKENLTSYDIPITVATRSQNISSMETTTTTISITTATTTRITSISNKSDIPANHHLVDVIRNKINNIDLGNLDDDNISLSNGTLKLLNYTQHVINVTDSSQLNVTNGYDSDHLFGASLRDLADLVWNELNNQSETNHFDDQSEGEFRNEPDDDMIDNQTFLENEQLTTTRPSFDVNQIIKFEPNNGSIDGFLINNDPIQPPLNESFLTTTNIPTNTSINKVLIISEDSFDLYSLGNSNTTLLSIEDNDNDENIEDEFKLHPVTNSFSDSSPEYSTTTTTMKPTTVVNNIKHDQNNYPPIVIIENEFTQPVTRPTVKVSTVATQVLAYGTRISKKLLNFSSNKYIPSSHENNLLNNYYDTINKVRKVNISTTTSAPFTCKLNEFQCNGTNRCISFESICNRMLDCEDGSDELQCRCADYLLRDDTHRHKLCDGTIDCADLSDETINCPRCREGMFVCIGPTNQCIEMSKVCNGENDCANGDDEQNCIALIDEDYGNQQKRSVENHNPKGLLYIQHHGQWAPLCFDSYDLDSENWIDRYDNKSGSSGSTSTSISISSMIQINDMGQAVCKANYFTQLKKIDIITSKHRNISKFFAINSRISNLLKPTLSLWSNLFEKVPCKEKKVARIECSSIECGVRPLSSKLQRRIIGGQSSSFGSWPWQVALYREGEFQCGAVIINVQWLLTAAHCFYSTPGAYWTARSGVLRRGSLYRTYHEEIRHIEQVFIHPDYVDKGFLNDIAILRLDRPLHFSKYIRPICLPDEEDSHISKWNNQLCTTVGWGKLYEHGRIFPDTLQEVKLPIISTEECRKRTLFLPLYKITENMFCAGFELGGRDACLGDSGGPMMCQKENGKWILLGITSNGDGCGRAGRPGVYTKVFNYLPWIQSIINNEDRTDRGMESDQMFILKNHPYKTCKGYRCPLGKCLKPEQICDHIIDCEEDSSDERNCKNI